ncbi:MAG: hypothetical protein HUJ25_02975 [Crocinitomicaceae bacterium]|nr:hypothetical protein [Crocinitomicaceae bacterium]
MKRIVMFLAFVGCLLVGHAQNPALPMEGQKMKSTLKISTVKKMDDKDVAKEVRDLRRDIIIKNLMEVDKIKGGSKVDVVHEIYRNPEKGQYLLEDDLIRRKLGLSSLEAERLRAHLSKTK